MTSESAAKAIQHMAVNRDVSLEGFKALLAIPSISTDPAYKGEVIRCAAWVASVMTRIGMREARLIPTAGHPIIYSEWLEAGVGRPTVAIYAHYDVQPVDPLNLWETSPFEPSVREGRIYARGSVDDKCGVWGVLKALEAMFAAGDGKLPVNVKLIFEGEEEMGSVNMEPFVLGNRDLVKSDVFVLCDGSFDPDDPVKEYALRGIVAAQVKVSRSGMDVHSGRFGGAVQNPLHEMSRMIASFHDAAGRIQIPNFYDHIQPISIEEKANLDAVWEPRLDSLKAKTGVTQFWAETLGSFAERTTTQPTLDVNGLWGGYQGEGSKTVIPAEAGFKVTMRFVPDQKPQQIAKLFTDYMQTFVTDTLAVETTIQSMGWPTIMDSTGPIADALQRAFQTVCGKPLRWTRMGGSIPVGGTVRMELGIPVCEFGLGAGEQFHAPNEYLRLDAFYKGIDTLIQFLYNLGEEKGF